MQNELLLEIGTEEIPAGFIGPALENMQKSLAAKLAEQDLLYDTIQTAATPRRLAVCVRGLVEQQPDRREEFLGPARKAAYDADNRPTRAAIGFARSKGAAVEDLQIVETPKGEYVMLIRESRGEETKDLLPGILQQIITKLPFPKSMRWGQGQTAFARPIHWLLALYGGKKVDLRIGDIISGGTTRGHRFMSGADPIEVRDFADYIEKLKRNHVLVDLKERRREVDNEIRRAAAEKSGVTGARILEDEELVDVVTNLVEYPHGVCGVFEERFLQLPDDVLITAMREHQKYFCVTDNEGSLLANFIAVNNTRVADENLAAEGHQRVLRARLEDAFFFFKEDRRRKLADRVNDLEGIIFQAGLGTMLEKTERVAGLTRILARQLAPEHEEQAVRAAWLAKADLLTAMVNEFPSLQGVMGRDYALLDEEPREVAIAILEHYLPIRAGGKLPSRTPGALVGLADRLDTITGCFGIGQVPTGTTDPFGLRRLALGFLHIIEAYDFTLSLSGAVEAAFDLYGAKLTEGKDTVRKMVIDFIKGRFSNDLISRGLPGSAVEAVTSVSFDDVVDCRARIEALAAIREQSAFTLLAAAFKRVMNIIKDNAETGVEVELLRERAERGLYEALVRVQEEVEPSLQAKDYDKAMEIILRMKEPVDLFFDEVMVMTDDVALQRNRLNLLTAVSRLFLRIGDFSKMQAAVK